MAKYQGEPRKKIHSSETENFFPVVRMGKLQTRVYWQHALFIKIAIAKQKIGFWPWTLTFSGHNCTFSSLAANWRHTGQCFQHERGVSLVPWYEGTKRFTPFPPKMDFWPKNSQIWSKTGIFGPVVPMPDQKNANKVPRWVFCYVGTKTVTGSHEN